MSPNWTRPRSVDLPTSVEVSDFAQIEIAKPHDDVRGWEWSHVLDNRIFTAKDREIPSGSQQDQVNSVKRLSSESILQGKATGGPWQWQRGSILCVEQLDAGIAN